MGGQGREGAGLVLSLAKRFVELYGGSMWVEAALPRNTSSRIEIRR
jgi:signal transduction histidine kinase